MLADEIERFTDVDGTLRLPTVTGVEIAPGPFDGEGVPELDGRDISEALGERRAHLQRVIGRQVRMKRTPKLQFVADPGVAEGAKVEEILRRLKKPGQSSAEGRAIQRRRREIDRPRAIGEWDPPG